MQNICMCKEHTDMINNLPIAELIELSNQQSNFISQLDVLIHGLDDPLFTVAAPILMEWKGTPMLEILENFKKVRTNAMQIFDIVQEEIKNRLDNTKEPVCLASGKPFHTATVLPDGTIEYTKVKKYD